MYEDATAIIDPVQNEEFQNLFFPGTPFDEVAFDSLQEALRESRYILATHEHGDHVGGIATSPYLNESGERLLLTTEQIESLKLDDRDQDKKATRLFRPEFYESYKPLRYDRYHLVAPGLVLIKSPGHTPGSQMVNVRLQDGTEFLLVGDLESASTPPRS